MKSIHIGIAGCGNAGKGHLENYLGCGGKNVHVWDIREEAARQLAVDSIAQIAFTFDELIHHPDINAVVIATPNQFHAQMAIQAMEAGKHVLLEKPMALNVEDAKAVTMAADRCDRILHVGFELRHSTFPMLVKELIASGEIGSLISAHIVHFRGHFWPHWKGKLESGGDMFLMEDCHAIDLFRWWSGDEVETIHAVGVLRNVVQHYEYPDTQFSTFVFHHGLVAHISDCHTRSAMPEKKVESSSIEGYAAPELGHQYEYSIVGEAGSLHFLPLQGVCHIYRHELQNDGAVFQRLSRTVEFPNYSEAIHNGGNQMTLFLEMLAEKRPPIVEPCDALQSHLVCFAARQAQVSGQPVKMAYSAPVKTLS